MNRVIVLDTGVGGLLTHPDPSSESKACRQWLNELRKAGDIVVVPEIVDYELRREFLLRRSASNLRHLSRLAIELEYVPITTLAMQQAAAFWAEIRQQGKPTADPHALDGDVILAAQAVLLEDLGGGIVIATTNVRHLSRFADARLWTDIKPEA